MDRPPCWSCKHGLCTRLGKGKLLKEVLVDKEKEDWQVDPDDETEQEMGITTHEYYTLCYWTPEHMRDKFQGPTEVFDVQECSRHEEDST